MPWGCFPGSDTSLFTATHRAITEGRGYPMLTVRLGRGRERGTGEVVLSTPEGAGGEKGARSGEMDQGKRMPGRGEQGNGRGCLR